MTATPSGQPSNTNRDTSADTSGDKGEDKGLRVPHADLTAGMLSNEIGAARERIDATRRDIDASRQYLARQQQYLSQQDAHLRALLSLWGLLHGRFQMLAPADVRSDDDVLGLAVGPLPLAPPASPADEDLVAYAELMRALYEQATHQTVLAGHALARRRAVATQSDSPALSGACADKQCDACQDPANNNGGCRCGCHVFTIGPDPEPIPDQDEAAVP